MDLTAIVVLCKGEIFLKIKNFTRFLIEKNCF